jgi:hypothetical protein
MIEQDYDNGCLLLKRGDKVIKTFTFKEFVSAKQFKPVNKLRNELIEISQGRKNLTQLQVDKVEKDFYEQTSTVGLENPLSYDEALNIMTIAEISNLSEQVLIFLANWSSIDEVKAYAKRVSETAKNDTSP